MSDADKRLEIRGGVAYAIAGLAEDLRCGGIVIGFDVVEENVVDDNAALRVDVMPAIGAADAQREGVPALASVEAKAVAVAAGGRQTPIDIDVRVPIASKQADPEVPAHRYVATEDDAAVGAVDRRGIAGAVPVRPRPEGARPERKPIAQRLLDECAMSRGSPIQNRAQPCIGLFKKKYGRSHEIG